MATKADQKQDKIMSQMDEIEKNNYRVLKTSNKNWSDDEALEMATNPAGRLSKKKSRSERMYPDSPSIKNNKDGKPSVKKPSEEE